MNLDTISFRLPRPGFKRGGVERTAHELANGLARRGHAVTMWSADPAPSDAQYDMRQLPGAPLIHHWLGFRLASGYLGNVLSLLPAFRESDCIVAHGDSLLLPLRGIPVLRIMHGSALDEARTARSAFRKVLQSGVYLQERLTVRSQTTVAISANTQARYPAIKTVIAHGVDTEIFRPQAAAKSSSPSILFVGTVGGRKRGGELVAWFRDAIRPAMPNAKLWMVSDPGPAEAGVEYITGASDEHLRELYQRAWVYASPSVYEGFGLPYLEAMASGTPVIATANPGSHEVLDGGRAGYLVEDDAQFAPAILALLLSASARRHWAGRGRERALELSLDRTLDRYETILDSLVASRRARREVTA